MDDTIECPKCGNEMHLDIVDLIGAHYECTNCDHEWCDTSAKEEVDEDSDDI